MMGEPDSNTLNSFISNTEADLELQAQRLKQTIEERRKREA